ncbi:MAG: DUF3786 domain-containing protein [Candidatus Bathyarchaeia archaeon]
MENYLKISEVEKARLITLVRRAIEGGSSAIRMAFGGELLERGIGFKATVLGIEYLVSVIDEDVEASFADPLRREVDAHKVITYMVNALERVLADRIIRYRGCLVGIGQLRGGSSAHLYERRMTNYLAVELDSSSLQEVERAVKALGGCMIDHPTATWSFEISPLNGLRVAVMFWQGEEGIPSGASILFGEEAIDAGIPIEEITVITEMIVDRFVAFYRRESGRKPRLFKSLYL